MTGPLNVNDLNPPLTSKFTQKLNYTSLFSCPFLKLSSKISHTLPLWLFWDFPHFSRKNVNLVKTHIHTRTTNTKSINQSVNTRTELQEESVSSCILFHIPHTPPSRTRVPFASCQRTNSEIPIYGCATFYRDDTGEIGIFPFKLYSWMAAVPRPRVSTKLLNLAHPFLFGTHRFGFPLY